ncbi:MAG: DUF1016 N-terminal domain-containing protein [Propionibacteriaceae bacterium]|nr:DUF1016 N-terminal domain-containing protein [Propionibacteriaceae bacterium]
MANRAASVGEDILERQEREGWGAGAIRRFSGDVTAEFPGMKGWSPMNLYYRLCQASGDIVCRRGSRQPTSHPGQPCHHRPAPARDLLKLPAESR